MPGAPSARACGSSTSRTSSTRPRSSTSTHTPGSPLGPRPSVVKRTRCTYPEECHLGLASPTMPSAFSQIVTGEIPAERIREDDDFLAFLDIRPIRAGHTLVIPKREIDHFFDLPDDLLGGLMVFAKPVANAIREVTGAARVGCAVVGIEVPHAHLHLVPVDGAHDIDFRRAEEADPDDLRAMGERVRARLS